MAVAKPSLSVDHYSCSLCLDVLKKPVTIPCGHSYCMHCINDYWDKLDAQGIYNCPQCRLDFEPRPSLYINTALEGLIEKVKQMQVNITQSLSYAESDDVSCDVCPERKLKAMKTCLTCLVSYCGIHLQPHQESEALKRHKLAEPTGNLQEKLCWKHQKMLEIFCRSDELCVCSMCAATEHKIHDIVTIDEERAGRQSELDKRMEEMKKRIEEKEKKLEEMKETIKIIQTSTEGEVQEQEKAFTCLLKSIERLRSDVISLIRGYERKEIKRVEELIEEIEKEIEMLKTRDIELAELSKTDDHIHFLKKFPFLCVPPGDGGTFSITVGDNLKTLKKNLSDLKISLEEMRGWELMKISETEVDTPDYILQNVRNRNYFVKFSCSVTLDHNTANRHLIFSDGNMKVTYQKTESPYPDHPDRFDYWPQVLCREALSGTRCYWEVEWSGMWTVIGVTYKGISRKESDSLLGFNDRSWRLFCSDSSYSAWHNKKKTEIDVPTSHKIGVYLDCPAGFLSFYSVSDTLTLLHRFKASLTEPVYLGFGVGPNSMVSVCPLNLLSSVSRLKQNLLVFWGGVVKKNNAGGKQ
ncbi:tripartite motif-containing protein 16-like isoform X2 [Erpetoichthys calabaricus]|uniref:tripartite motif-containing protein 16-like isoform X2 n=1 Tax=Erpetoichthys calabaricus TaxID=27687 RepID=UPI0022343B6B|nr:tripartite motif-containing protein 16-like isoform X2 [Erpetoichthys calabaricus]